MDDLKEYRAKRNFPETPEPGGGMPEPVEKNRFVVQRHLARREHYDFRLQVGSVLVSWAIPKKPVHDPKVKRLAIKVEDHPLEYIHFEGNIPKGHYGAGTVMVWDIGYYYIEPGRVFPPEDVMIYKIDKGAMKIHLQGSKLRGTFNLFRSGDRDSEQWIFTKAPDEVPGGDPDERSALTGRNMEEIAASDRIWDPEKPPAEAARDLTGEEKKLADWKNGGAAGRKTSEEDTMGDKKDSTIQVRKQDFPGFIEPMLATLTGRPFSDDQWIFELKYDGYRVIAAKGEPAAAKNKAARLYSRNGNDFSKRYPLIVEELSDIKAAFIIDGEVCYVEPSGKTDFQKLQDQSHDQDRLHYYVFDLLWLNGHDLKEAGLTERKELLRTLLKKAPPHIHYLDHIENEGEKFFREVEKKGLEGIIAKHAGGNYQPGARSDRWLKIKTGHRQEMIICGYLPSERGRAFRSLLCAVYENGKLVYTGRVGTGFSEKLQKEILKKASGLKTKKVPVENPPREKDIQWLKPELICEVKFSGWTVDRIMRHPRFVGLRSDKKPEQVRIEKPEQVRIEKPEQVRIEKPGQARIEKNKPPEDVTATRVKLTNLDKVFWPEEGYTKEDVIHYYSDIAGTILPYLVDRPQSLYRTPDGIRGEGFFQKNVEGIAPGWARTVKVESGGKKKEIEYLLCQDRDTLLFMANLGCVEINPWSSSLPDLDKPDFMIFDLDPVDVEFTKLIHLAHEFRKLFEQLRMPSYVKTSGSRGIHIYVPLERNYTYEQVQNFVKIIEGQVHRQNKGLTSFERSPSKRKGKIYLDYLQNARGKTMSSVYSIRPRPGATVSAPLRWDELTPDLEPSRFNLGNMMKRLEKVGDVWEGIFDNRIDMKKVLNGNGPASGS